ncbi:MAG: alpha/beta fold hydrolase [Aequorivita sp.]
MKTPLLLLHGALGSKEQFLPLQEILSSNREVFIMDFDGHGNSRSDKDFSIELFTQNVVQFLEEHNISKVDIFGYSMGGYVALNVAKEHPLLINDIVTLGTKFDWTKSFAEKEVKMLNPEQIQIKVPNFADRIEQLHGENWKIVVSRTAGMMTNLGDSPNLNQNDFEHIKNRSLICLGELDKMSTIEESEKVANWMPNANFQSIPNFKHPIEAVSNNKLASIINNFLD